VESNAGKRQELYDLVAGLVAGGVPIDGVALQMHITDMVESYNALGLDVSIAELDVHVLDDELQADIYGAVMREALSTGITDISFWGFTDKHLYTWLPGAKSLMFDEYYRPKKVYFATHAALEDFAGQSSKSPINGDL
jgi:GH35 family endo-1,4-beta-xylanase